MVVRKRKQYQQLRTNFVESKLPDIMTIVGDVKRKEQDLDLQIDHVTASAEQQASSLKSLVSAVQGKLSDTLEAEKVKELSPWKKLSDEIEGRLKNVQTDMEKFEQTLEGKEVRHLPAMMRKLTNDMDFRKDLAIPIIPPHKMEFEGYNIDENVVEKIFGRLRKVIDESRIDELPLIRPRLLPPPKCEISVLRTLDFSSEQRKGLGVTFLANMDDKTLIVGIDKQLFLAEKFRPGWRKIERVAATPLCQYNQDAIVLRDDSNSSRMLLLNVNGKMRSYQKLQQGEISGALVTRSRHTIVTLFTEEDCYGELIRHDKDFKPIQRVDTKDDGTYIFAKPFSIAENRNYDLWVTDTAANTVDVIDKLGNSRFTYEPKEQLSKFEPQHVVCDSNLNALISDTGHKNIHVLDRNGSVLRYLQTYDLDIWPLTLAIEREGQLWVGDYKKSKIYLIQYF
ncbi:hypothetical protein FSP39_019685 [Pinctada imbricata]|uniref:Tripartite motif-containing protein 3 n=1 Tax=Pinctada imbricata TaxID=66713 RepID=A0AA88YKZ7_PINIB|nr:hypothetical protein FSP39_019685 [Pinctada imbricata]